MNVIPLFTSAYSFKSILSLDSPDACVDGGPDSIIKIAVDNKIKKVFLIEENMTSFLEAKKQCSKNGLDLAFGIRFNICSNLEANDLDKEFKEKTSKIIILANNDDGYFKLIKIFSQAATGIVYKGNHLIDYKTLASLWDDKSLTLVVPFYDSFIFNNAMYFCECIPDFNFIKSVVFFAIEDNKLFFDKIIQDKVEDYCKINKHGTIKTKTIRYNTREDFVSFQTYKCLENRTTLREPNMEHFSSREFCVEAWKEQNGQ